jgi:hypothetical protein
MESRPEGSMQRRDPAGPVDPAQAHPSARLRISDDDRHRVAEVLRTAAGEGRIDLDELDERLEATYAAKTYADLVPITADLPLAQSGHAAPAPGAPGRAPAGPPVPASSYTSSVAVMSETKRRGTWLVPEHHTAFAFMGSVQLDLREAQLAAREVVINASAIMGDVKIVVNAHTHVVVDGVAFMAEYSEAREKVRPELTADSPVVRVKGLALMASVTVQRKPMPGTTQRRLGWKS